MRCVATNRKNKRPCKKHAMHGFDVCMTHNPAAEESRNRAKAKLVPGGPKNEPLATPEVSALMDEIAEIESRMSPALKDADGHALADRELVQDYGEVRLEIVELRKRKPRTQAVQRLLDSAIKRRDSYRDALGLGGPGTREKFDSLDAGQRQARAKQGARPLRTEERAMAVARLLQASHAIPTLPPLDDGDEPNTPPPLTVVEQNGEQ
jgi:hypothetical protein